MGPVFRYIRSKCPCFSCQDHITATVQTQNQEGQRHPELRHPRAAQEQQRELYREVQLDVTPEIEVFHMMFERFHAVNRKKSFK